MAQLNPTDAARDSSRKVVNAGPKVRRWAGAKVQQRNKSAASLRDYCSGFHTTPHSSALPMIPPLTRSPKINYALTMSGCTGPNCESSRSRMHSGEKLQSRPGCPRSKITRTYSSKLAERAFASGHPVGILLRLIEHAQFRLLAASQYSPQCVTPEVPYEADFG